MLLDFFHLGARILVSLVVCIGFNEPAIVAECIKKPFLIRL